MNMIESICFVAAIIYILCDTSALEQYLRLIFSLFKIKSELVNPSLDMGLPFISRLRLKYQSGVSVFFVNLLECPICLSVWVCSFLGVLKFGLDVEKIATLIVGSWWTYLVTRFLVKSANK